MDFVILMKLVSAEGSSIAYTTVVSSPSLKTSTLVLHENRNIDANRTMLHLIILMKLCFAMAN